MRVLPDLPDLRILPTAALHPHEHHDHRRTAPLAQALRREGVLRNPPIVLRIGGKHESYVVLDGANRTMAFRQLGLEHVLAQVVHPGDNRVEVETWNHVVLNLDEGELVRELGRVDGVIPEPIEADMALADLAHGASLALLALRGGHWLSLAAPVPSLRARVEGLNRIVSAYQERARVERTNARTLDELAGPFPTAAGLMVFRTFEVQEVVDAVVQDLLLPAGLTRFIVSPRALRVNYPLEAVTGSESRESKEAALREWIEDRLAARRVRYYAEATYLFDE